MKLKADKNDIILYPENDWDIFVIGKLSLKTNVEVSFESDTLNPEQKMSQVKISIKNLLELLNKVTIDNK